MMDKVTQGEIDGIKESLAQRDQDRKEKLKILKEQKELLSPNQAKIFEVTFDSQKKSILDKIKLIEEKKIDEKDLPEHLNILKKEINAINKYLAVSTKFLTGYVVEKSLETVNTFENKLKDLEGEVLPKKRFAFKAKKNKEIKKSVPKNVTPISNDEVDSADREIASLSIISCGFSDRKNENLKLCNDEIAKKDVELRNLDNCIVFLCGNPSTVHMSNITKCKLLFGPVSTSVFLENCSNNEVVVACQQLRIHSTKDSRFYIHITSRVVVEDTNGLQFAPYNLEYKDLETHFEKSGLSKSPNNWNLIDDFNWLASDAPSPHWSIISAEERVLNWTSFIQF